MTPLPDLYRRFAETEAQGVSPLYETLARAAADSLSVMRFVESLPENKRQPQLLFAAIRAVAAPPEDLAGLEAALEAHGPAIRATLATHANQTNEPGRCAALMPVLGFLPGPLALIEIGASAGLCLLPDRYGYDFGRVRIAPPGPDAPIFSCSVNFDTPLPDRLPQVAWRAGLDMNPLDANDDDARDWLLTLVWPEQTARAERLGKALELARTETLDIRKGDLFEDLDALIDAVPRGLTPVVFHTAVLAYTPDVARREAFAAEMHRRHRARGVHWIANESPRVFPSIAEQAGPRTAPGRFLLSLDGAPLAWTAPHGQAMEWIGD